MLGSPTNTREATPFRTYIILYCYRDGIAEEYPGPGTKHRRPNIVPGPQGQTGPPSPRRHNSAPRPSQALRPALQSRRVVHPPLLLPLRPPQSSPFARLLSRSLLSPGSGVPRFRSPNPPSALARLTRGTTPKSTSSPCVSPPLSPLVSRSLGRGRSGAPRPQVLGKEAV